MATFDNNGDVITVGYWNIRVSLSPTHSPFIHFELVSIYSIHLVTHEYFSIINRAWQHH